MQTRRYSMTWDGKRRRWIKKFRGRQYKFPALPHENKEESHKRCFALWQAKQAELAAADGVTDRDRLFRKWREQLTATLWISQRVDSIDAFNDTLRMWKLQEHVLASGKDYTPEEIRAAFLEPHKHLDMYGLQVGDSRDAPCGHLQSTGRPKCLDDLPEQPTINKETSLRAVADRWLAEIDGSKLSVGRKSALRRWIAKFVDHAGGDLDVSQLTTGHFKTYYTIVQAGVGGEYGDAQGKNLWTTARQFVNWIFAQTDLVIILPPAAIQTISALLHNGNMSIAVQPKQVETAELDTIRRMLNAGTDHQRLYMLLALNCAQTPKDVTGLLVSEIDWECGIITRPRSKTRRFEGQPVVSYVLWRQTFDLLKKLANRESGRLLPISKSGIEASLRRLRQDMELAEDISMGTLKKTSASLLGGKFNNDLADLWLSHSPRGVGRKNYIAPSQEKLDQAVRWLETKYFDVPQAEIVVGG